jgi:hypothetical protein
MNFFVWFFVLLHSIRSQILNGLEPEFDPSIEELSRGLAVKPYGSWGYNIRKEKNVRLLALGMCINILLHRKS